MLKIDEAAQHVDFLTVSAKKKIPQMRKILKKPQWKHLPGLAEVKSLKRSQTYGRAMLSRLRGHRLRGQGVCPEEAFQEGQIGALCRWNAQPDVGPVRDKPTRLEQRSPLTSDRTARLGFPALAV